MRITRTTLKKLIEQIAGLRSVGDTADVILLGKWYDPLDPSCGCVVGSYLGGKAPDFNSRLFDFGQTFDERLRAQVDGKLFGRVEVINR